MSHSKVRFKNKHTNKQTNKQKQVALHPLKIPIVIESRFLGLSELNTLIFQKIFIKFNLFAKCIEISTNKCMFGPVVLEIPPPPTESDMDIRQSKMGTIKILLSPRWHTPEPMVIFAVWEIAYRVKFQIVSLCISRC